MCYHYPATSWGLRRREGCVWFETIHYLRRGNWRNERERKWDRKRKKREMGSAVWLPGTCGPSLPSTFPLEDFAMLALIMDGGRQGKSKSSWEPSVNSQAHGKTQRRRFRITLYTKEINGEGREDVFRIRHGSRRRNGRFFKTFGENISVFPLLQLGLRWGVQKNTVYYSVYQTIQTIWEWCVTEFVSLSVALLPQDCPIDLTQWQAPIKLNHDLTLVLLYIYYITLASPVLQPKPEIQRFHHIP